MTQPAGDRERLEVFVNARNLTGPMTGIEVYMLELLGALARTGRLDLTALSWSQRTPDRPSRLPAWSTWLITPDCGARR